MTVETMELDGLIPRGFLCGMEGREHRDYSRLLIHIRRGAIVGIAILAYFYYLATDRSLALASIGLFSATRPRSVGDFDNEPLDGARLRLGRLELVALLAVMTVTTLGSGITSAAPAFAAVLATGAFGVRELVSS